jgi:hypothetical protein
MIRSYCCRAKPTLIALRRVAVILLVGDRPGAVDRRVVGEAGNEGDSAPIVAQERPVPKHLHHPQHCEPWGRACGGRLRIFVSSKSRVRSKSLPKT